MNLPTNRASGPVMVFQAATACNRLRGLVWVCHAHKHEIDGGHPDLRPVIHNIRVDRRNLCALSCAVRMLSDIG